MSQEHRVVGLAHQHAPGFVIQPRVGGKGESLFLAPSCLHSPAESRSASAHSAVAPLLSFPAVAAPFPPDRSASASAPDSSGRTATHARRTLHRRSIASRGSLKSQPPPAHRSHRTARIFSLLSWSPTTSIAGTEFAHATRSGRPIERKSDQYPAGWRTASSLPEGGIGPIALNCDRR